MGAGEAASSSGDTRPRQNGDTLSQFEWPPLLSCNSLSITRWHMARFAYVTLMYCGHFVASHSLGTLAVGAHGLRGRTSSRERCRSPVC